VFSVVAGAPPQVQRNRELGDDVASSSPASILLRSRAELVAGWMPNLHYCLRIIIKLICISPPLCVEPLIKAVCWGILCCICEAAERGARLKPEVAATTYR
jgi:hypothetical protein